MATPILYYWEPCTTCAIATRYANEHGIDLDLRDVEQVGQLPRRVLHPECLHRGRHLAYPHLPAHHAHLSSKAAL